MERNKKVLLVSNTAWSLVNFRLILAQFLNQNNCTVRAVAPFDDYAQKLAQEGIAFSSIKMDNKGSNPLKDLALLIRFLIKYAIHNPTLIIHYTIKPNIYGSIAARLLGKKSMAVVTGLGYAFIKRGFTTKLVMLLYKIAFKCSNQVLFLNETDRTFFCRLGIVSRNKTTVIPGEGIDTSHFTPRAVNADQSTTFLFIGRLLYDKGIGELISAMRMIRQTHPTVKLQVVGFLDALNPTAVSKADLDAWIEEGLVEYVGAHADVRPFIAQASCLVLPSYREGISRTLLEAASMAKPIIATDVVGCREVVKQNFNGFLCEVKNDLSLFQAMSTFVTSDIQKRTEMGNNGRLLVQQEFANEQVLKAYTPLLNRFLQQEFILSPVVDLPSISIITVIYQNYAFVRDAINSVLEQSHNQVQYIVIDGGSNDGSLEIINSFGSKISVVVSEPDEGIYDAMNKGLALATGDVIGFLNADDFYAHRNVLAHVAQKFAFTQVDAIYADLDYVSRANKQLVVRKWRSGAFHKDHFKWGWMPPHPTFFVKKGVYQKLGGYLTSLSTAADYELMLRFCYFKNISVVYLPEVLVKMRLGGQSNRSLKNRVWANLQDRKAWVVNGQSAPWYTLLLKPLSKIKQYFI